MRLSGRFWRLFLFSNSILLANFLASPTFGEEQSLRVSPLSVSLDSPEASQQLLVATGSEIRPTDLTHKVRYSVLNSEIASVLPSGRVLPRAEGTTVVLIEHNQQTLKVPVNVTGLESPQPVSFRREVIPILTKAGCNSGGCHGKAEGQNGFKLSIFGFDAISDHDALVKEARGRRVIVATPDRSLLLQKATAEMPHGGGQKIEPGSFWYQRLSRWVREGAMLDEKSDASITHIEVEPTQLQMEKLATQQLRVTAVDHTGYKRCVTVEAEFLTNAEEIAGVDRLGKVTTSDIPGEAAILVRYLDHVTICRITIPQESGAFQRPLENNFIDKHVWNKLKGLGIQPSGTADDATFLRRVYLDTIGTLPTVSEARTFLDDKSPDKRSQLIDRLLKRDEYADLQAMKWADILRVDKAIITPQGSVGMTRWLRQQFRENRPYDEFVKEIITARGNTQAESPAAFYQVHPDPQMLSRSISQVFLGVRLECAECHHHPFERWSQADYFAFAGFFTSIKNQKSPTGGLKIIMQPGKDLPHPRTNEPVPAAALGAPAQDLTEEFDRRDVLANWMTAPDNPFLARMIVNRIWSHYFDRGIVEPIDDIRATNPATNEPLFEALTQHLIELKFDLKQFTRTLLNSRVYQLQAETTPSNKTDAQNFSHAAWKSLPAEVLLDAISQVTQMPEEFNGWPEGTRAVQVWDNRMPSYFFRIFGRPQRVSVCECERSNEPSIAQALHLMNSPELIQKIRHRDGRAAALAASKKSDQEIIEELYLATLSRFPAEKERTLMQQAFTQSTNRRTAVEDILWALLNTREFVYNH